MERIKTEIENFNLDNKQFEFEMEHYEIYM